MKETILMIYPKEATWVQKDLEILSTRYDVIPINYSKIICRLYDVNCLLKKLKLIFKHASKATLIYAWFANVHSFLARIISRALKKPMILAVGGGDVTCIHSLSYGGLYKNPERYYIVESIRGSDLILAPSNFTKMEVLKVAPVERKVVVVYHGFDHEKFKPGNKKENLVVTIAHINRVNLLRKGLITFVKAAKYLPDIKFMLIGKQCDTSIDILKSIAPPNVVFTGYLPEKKLINVLQRAKVYVQASIHEGFGCALAEAMLAECVPVVTSFGAIPEVVGSEGFYVRYGDPKALAEAIKLALDSQDIGKKARKRIKSLFSLEKRKRKLLTIIQQVISKK